jgi:hypothetical protein
MTECSIAVLWCAALVPMFAPALRRTAGRASRQQPTIEGNDVHERRLDAIGRCRRLDLGRVEILAAIGDRYQR